MHSNNYDPLYHVSILWNLYKISTWYFMFPHVGVLQGIFKK